MLCRQFFESQNRGSDHMTQGVQEQSRTLPAIEPELHLREIGREMLGADLVPRSHDAAFQEGERRFDGVSVDITIDVDFRFMSDGFVLGAVNSSANHRLWVGRHFVCDHHFNVCTNAVLNILRQGSRFCIARMKETEIAATLTEADYNLFVIVRSVPSLAAMLLSTDIGFVHFDSPVQHWPIYFLHGRSDAMAEVPSGFVRAVVLSPDRALELVGTHALAGLAEKQGSEEPLLQGKMGVIEDRASSDGELVVTTLAIEQLFRCLKFNYSHLAARAFRAIRPAEPDKNLAAFFVSIEQVDNVN